MIPWPEPCKARARELFTQTITMRECAEIINREFGTTFTEMALKAMRKRMGVSRPRAEHRFEWTQERLALLRKGAEDKIGLFATARLVGASRDIVSYQCGKLGLKLEKAKKAPQWTEERNDELRRLRADGMTTLQIAEVMNIKRGAVIARLGRMGIKAADPSVKRVRAAKTKAAKPPKVQKPPSPFKANRLGTVAGFYSLGAPPTDEGLALLDKDMALPESRRLSIDRLRNSTCRFPIGHPRDEGFSYCGAPGADYAAGKPYCKSHAQISYRPSQERKREDRYILRVTQRVSA